MAFTKKDLNKRFEFKQRQYPIFGPFNNYHAYTTPYSVMYLFPNDHCRVKGINRQSHILFASGVEKTLFSPYQGFTRPLKEAFIQDSIPILLKSFASNFNTPKPKILYYVYGKLPNFHTHKLKFLK